DYFQIAGAAKTTKSDGQLCLAVHLDGLAANPADEVRPDDSELFLIDSPIKHQLFILARLVAGDPDLTRLRPGNTKDMPSTDFVGAKHFPIHVPGFIDNAQGTIPVVQFSVRLDGEVFRDAFLHGDNEVLDQGTQLYRLHN